jgi:hypothetical protein
MTFRHSLQEVNKFGIPSLGQKLLGEIYFEEHRSIERIPITSKVNISL